LNAVVERWELFPFVSFYLKDHGWVYEGAGRWSRRDLLMWVKKVGNNYAVELWDLAVAPVLRLRKSLNKISGLSLLFSE